MTKLNADTELDECLYRWYLTEHSEGVPLSGPTERSQVAKFHHDSDHGKYT